MHRTARHFVPNHLFPLSMLTPVLCLLAGCIISGGAKKSAGPELAVNVKDLDFGESKREFSFAVTNIGGGKLEWNISPEGVPEWCRFEPQSGVGNSEIAVAVDRTNLDPGTYETVLTVRSNGGTKTVTVRMIVPEGRVSGTIIIDTLVPK